MTQKFDTFNVKSLAFWLTFFFILQRREEAKGILKDIQNRRAKTEGAYSHPVRMDDSLGSICPDPLNISTRTPSVCLSPVNLKFDIGDDWKSRGLYTGGWN